MKVKTIIVLLVLGAALAACSKPDSLSVFSNSIQIGYAGGDAQISFITNRDWSVSSNQPWITLSPSSGSGSENSQRVTVTAEANPGDAERSAELTVRAGELSHTVSVTQPAIPRLTISEFRAKKADKTTWYKLTGQIASIANESYGNFYITDDTGYVYVYGLCEKQVATNDQSFSKLGLKTGDTVTMMTLRSEYDGTAEAGGTTPAYFVSKTEAAYKMGKKVAAASEKWLELPATSSTDKQDLLIHYFPGGKRSFAAYWDYDNLVSSWVAYPLCAGNMGTGGRTDSFSLDPLLPRDKQQYIPSPYKAGNGGTYDRGHQIPSADRLDYRVNLETFFGINMTPQDPGLNSNAWAILEGKVRDWARKSDTLYVVTGCTVAGSTTYVLDYDSKHITVPTGYYKALLRLSKGEYSALGIYFDNKPNDAPSIQKSMTMSVDDLEKKVGVDFFVNLPADVQKTVEAQNPADDAWWWNN